VCGIVGFIKLDKNKKGQISYEDMSNAFIETEKRGMGATGFFSTATGVVKDGIPGSHFVKKFDKELKEALSSDVLIGHCRAATSGIYGKDAPASKNENNHPHEGTRFVLVHNGHFSNLPLIKGYKYKGNCDSEIPVSYFETWGVEKSIPMFSKTDGFSLVIYDKKDGIVYFYREANPLEFTVDSKLGLVAFGSTTDIIREMSDFDEKYGFESLTQGPIFSTHANHLYVVKPEKGLISHEEIKLRLTNEELRTLPKEIRSKLELDDFFDSKTATVISYGRGRRWEGDEVCVSRRSKDEFWNTTLGHRSTQTNIQNTNSNQYSRRLVFTVLKDGRINYFPPFEREAESTYQTA